MLVLVFFQMTIANKPDGNATNSPVTNHSPLITAFLIDTPAIGNHPNSLKTIGGDHV
jgi:hypothetical protein